MLTKYNIKKEFEKENEVVQDTWVLKSTPFIVCDIFLERYCTAGILTILPLFLHIKLGLEQDVSTSLFHIFEGLMLVFTIFGTIVADTWIGLYRAVVTTSLIYVAGLTLVSVTMIDSLHLSVGAFVAAGLIVMMVGSGSLKNNLNAFGGGQHKPEQKQQLETYFSVQYFGVKCGSFLARVIFPMIRADVKCFGANDCYSLSFGIPAAIMLIATVIFLSGSKTYSKLEPNGNMLVKVAKCIKNAVKEKSKRLPESEKKHWLEYAEEKYGKKLVMETKIALKVVLMSLPVPIFWSGLMQQRSRFIFQATLMDGDLGFYTIKPDQMIVLNSFMAITMIPILDKFVYPLLEKIGIKSMLDRLIFGGVLIVIAFTLSTILETQIQRHYISILWQLPQYITIGIAEIFTYLSHLNFAYKEAPPSMKPVMMSLLYLSMAGGDMIVAIISGLAIFPSQTLEFAFYTCLILLDVVVLAILAHSYKSTDFEALKCLDSETVNKEANADK